MIMELKITLCEFFGRGEPLSHNRKLVKPKSMPPLKKYLAAYRGQVQELLNHGAGVCLYALRWKCQSSTPSIKSRLVSSKLPPQIFAASSSVILLVATAFTKFAQTFVMSFPFSLSDTFIIS